MTQSSEVTWRKKYLTTLSHHAWTSVVHFSLLWTNWCLQLILNPKTDLTLINIKNTLTSTRF